MRSDESSGMKKKGRTKMNKNEVIDLIQRSTAEKSLEWEPWGTDAYKASRYDLELFINRTSGGSLFISHSKSGETLEVHDERVNSIRENIKETEETSTTGIQNSLNLWKNGLSDDLITHFGRCDLIDHLVGHGVKLEELTNAFLIATDLASLQRAIDRLDYSGHRCNFFNMGNKRKLANEARETLGLSTL